MFTKMRSSLVVVVIILIATNLNPVSSTDIVDHPHHFCYSEESCAPNNAEVWPGACQSGESQSPIDLVDGPADEEVEVPLRHLKTDHFFIQNNGHTVNLDFPNENEFGDSYFFPSYGLSDRLFRLSNVHFHWGSKDEEGSEHTVDGKSYSMEMHLVHYNADYLNSASAVGSGDKNALSVVGIFLDVDASAAPNPALTPVVASLKNIEDVHSYWVRVDEALDLSSLMPKAGATVFSYQGSLTTPGCNEQVNWYVFKDPVSISPSDVKAFRDIMDGEMGRISENHRPVQKPFNRTILIRTATGGQIETSTDASATTSAADADPADNGGEDDNTKPSKKSCKKNKKDKKGGKKAKKPIKKKLMITTH